MSDHAFINPAGLSSDSPAAATLIVRSIVRRLGGTIEIEPPFGDGANLAIHCPLTPEKL